MSFPLFSNDDDTIIEPLDTDDTQEIAALDAPEAVADAPLLPVAPPPRPAPPSDWPQTPARQVRILHFADVHLGVESYGRYNPQTGLNTRLEDFTGSLNKAIDQALDAQVDLAVFAGDAYKARDPNQTHQRAFALALKRLTDAGVPVVMLVGNHDIPNTRGRAHALEIYGLLGGAGVTILQMPEVVTIATRRGLVLVAGMPYLTRSRVIAQEEARGKSVEEVAHLIRDRYASYVAQLATDCEALPNHIAILTGHFTVADAKVGTQSFLMNPNEPQVAVSDLALPAFDYVAMGHVHKYQDMNRGDQPPVIYSGSVDRIDFGERTEEKGIVLADLTKGHADVKFVRLETRPFVQIEVDCKDSDDPTQVILDAIAQKPIAGGVVRVMYKVPGDKAALVRTDEIRKRLGAAHILVALTREMPGASSLTRSQAFTESLTPEGALNLYLQGQERLTARRDSLLAAARPLFEQIAREEAVEA